MAATGFRFNTMIDRDARKLGVQPTSELIERLRARHGAGGERAGCLDASGQGRPAGLNDLAGEGLDTLRRRMHQTA